MRCCATSRSNSPKLAHTTHLTRGGCKTKQHSWMQRIRNLQLGSPERVIGTDDPRHALQENGGQADQWYLDDGDILCHQYWFCPTYKRSTPLTLKLGQNETHRKTEFIHYVTDLLLSGTSTTFAQRPLLPQQSNEISQLGVGEPGRQQNQPHPWGYTATQFFKKRKEAANIFDEVGHMSLERLFSRIY